MDLEYYDDKIFLFPRLEPEVLNLVLSLLKLKATLRFIYTDGELNKHYQISFSLRSCVGVDEDLKKEKKKCRTQSKLAALY